MSSKITISSFKSLKEFKDYARRRKREDSTELTLRQIQEKISQQMGEGSFYRVKKKLEALEALEAKNSSGQKKDRAQNIIDLPTPPAKMRDILRLCVDTYDKYSSKEREWEGELHYDHGNHSIYMSWMEGEYRTGEITEDVTAEQFEFIKKNGFVGKNIYGGYKDRAMFPLDIVTIRSWLSDPTGESFFPQKNPKTYTDKSAREDAESLRLDMKSRNDRIIAKGEHGMNENLEDLIRDNGLVRAKFLGRSLFYERGWKKGILGGYQNKDGTQELDLESWIILENMGITWISAAPDDNNRILVVIDHLVERKAREESARIERATNPLFAFMDMSSPSRFDLIPDDRYHTRYLEALSAFKILDKEDK